MTKTLTSIREHGMRTLQACELDAVTGGIINDSCIRLPIPKIRLPGEPKPFVDQFASRLPSWVHPL